MINKTKKIILTIMYLALLVSVMASSPVINNVRISPLVAHVNDTLLAYCNASDEDLQNLTYQYKVYKDGVIILNSSNCLEGDTNNADGSCTKILRTPDTDVLDNAYIEKIFANKNNNGSKSLYITNNPSSAKRIYLKFNTSSILNLTVVNSKIYLYAATDGSTETQDLYQVYNDTWDEETITWNLQPTDYSQVLDSNSGTGLGYRSWDVTQSIINSSLYGNTTTSFMIRTDELLSNSSDVYASKENGTIAYLPYLNVTYTSNSYAQGIEINLVNITNLSGRSNYTFSCNAFDGVSQAVWVNSTVLTISNYPPSFNESDFYYNISHTTNISLQINATDFEGDVLTYAINESQFIINSSTGLITKANNISTVGEYNVSVNLSDGLDSIAMWILFNITNNKPSFNESSLQYSLSHYTNISIQMNASDEDNDLLIFTVNDSRFDINSSTGLITKANNISTVGEYNLSIIVNDGADSITAWAFFNITNSKPTFNESEIMLEILHTSNISLQMNATDIDGDIVFFTVNDSRFNINSSTGLITKANNILTVGEYNLSITLSDSQENVTTWVYFNITNNAPEMTSSRISPIQAYRNTTLEGYCNATDPDNDDVVYNYAWYVDGVISYSGNTTTTVSGVEFNAANITNISKNSNVTLSCIASDTRSNSSEVNSSMIQITNTPPTISQAPALYTDNDDIIDIVCQGYDLDSDDLTYNYTLYRNGVLNITTSNTTINQTLIVNDTWFVECNVFDGENYSQTLTSENITISNSSIRVDDIIFNATFNNGIISCDDLGGFYLVDTNWTEDNNYSKWNGYQNLTITLSEGFTNATIEIILDKSSSIINLTRDYGLSCTRNNLMNLSLNFSVNEISIISNRNMDLYYPTCNDLEIKPSVSSAYINSTFDLEQDTSLYLVNLNPYNDSEYFYRYSNITIARNMEVDGLNTQYYDENNNTLINETFGLAINNISFMSGAIFSIPYALANNNTYYLDMNISNSYNNFTCSLPVNFYNTRYPNISIVISANDTLVKDYETVNITFSIRNTGNNITNLSITPNINCTIPLTSNLGTNESTSYSCIYSTSSAKAITATAKYRNGIDLSSPLLTVTGTTITLEERVTTTKNFLAPSSEMPPSPPTTIIQEEVDNITSTENATVPKPEMDEIKEENNLQIEEKKDETSQVLEQPKEIIVEDTLATYSNRIKELIYEKKDMIRMAALTLAVLITLTFITVSLSRTAKEKRVIKQDFNNHNKNNEITDALVSYIRKTNNLRMSSESLISKGWRKEFVDKAIIESLKMKKDNLTPLEDQESLNMEYAIYELSEAGFSKEEISLLIKRHW